jgi:hypothetical protein
VRGDVDEGGDVRVIAGFGDDGAAVTVGDEDGGAVLQSEDAASGGDVVANVVSGSCTMVTWKPGWVRRSTTGCQPEPSAQAPWTRTMLWMGAAGDGAWLALTEEEFVAARKSRAAKSPASGERSMKRAARRWATWSSGMVR